MIGRKDLRGPEESQPDLGTEEEIDFAALEEAVIGRKTLRGPEESQLDLGTEEERAEADREKTSGAGEDLARMGGEAPEIADDREAEGREEEVAGEIRQEAAGKVLSDGEEREASGSKQMKEEKKATAQRRPARGRKMAYTVIKVDQTEKSGAHEAGEEENRSRMGGSPEASAKTGREKIGSLTRKKDEKDEIRSREREIGSDQKEEIKTTIDDKTEGSKEKGKAAGKIQKARAARRKGGRYGKRAETGPGEERKFRKRSKKKDRA